MSVEQDAIIISFRQHGKELFSTGVPVVLTVSGGADSLALMHLGVASGLVIPSRDVVAHFDHGLREESRGEAEFVINQAQGLGLECFVERWTDHALIAKGNLSERAREARYAFFLRIAQKCHAGLIATGHHKDDQAETFLDHLLRGSGTRGLSGMAARRPLTSEVSLIRPLLFFRRYELENWLTTAGVAWVEDPTNQNPKYLRNRIRHDLLAAFTRTAGYDSVHSITTTALQMARADTALDWMLERIWPELNPTLDTNHLSLTLSWSKLAALPDELICRSLVYCHKKLTKAPFPPGFRAREGFLYLVRTKRRQWSMCVRNLEIYRDHDTIFITAAISSKNGS
ncbi:MAG: tRNA lysidine(34) synthetase TilS [Magnetococcus sp. DMHC-6]